MAKIQERRDMADFLGFLLMLVAAGVIIALLVAVMSFAAGLLATLGWLVVILVGAAVVMWFLSGVGL